MKGRFLVALFLYLAFAVVFSGCRTVDTVEGQTAHHVALQALTSGNCKIVLEEIYIPSDRPEKLRTQQVSGSYFVIKGDKLRAYLTREVDGSKLFSGISPLNGGEADLQIGEPEVRNNGEHQFAGARESALSGIRVGNDALSRFQPMFRAGEQGLHGRKLQFQGTYFAFA